MKNKVLIFVLLVISFLLVGCSKKGEGIVGKWVSEVSKDIYYIFNDDNTCSYSNLGSLINCTYQDDKTRITILNDGSYEAFVFEYTLDNDTLIMQDSFGTEMSYKRK